MKLESIVHENTRIRYVDFRGAENDEEYFALFIKILEDAREKSEKFLALYNLQDVVW